MTDGISAVGMAITQTRRAERPLVKSKGGSGLRCLALGMVGMTIVLDGNIVEVGGCWSGGIGSRGLNDSLNACLALVVSGSSSPSLKYAPESSPE